MRKLNLKKIAIIMFWIVLALLIGDGKSYYSLGFILIRLACGFSVGVFSFHFTNFLERLVG